MFRPVQKEKTSFNPVQFCKKTGDTVHLHRFPECLRPRAPVRSVVGEPLVLQHLQRVSSDAAGQDREQEELEQAELAGEVGKSEMQVF